MEVRYEVKHGLFALLLASCTGLCLPLRANAESHAAPSLRPLAPVQTIDVTGYVHDANGEPVIGAGVQVVGVETGHRNRHRRPFLAHSARRQQPDHNLHRLYAARSEGQALARHHP